MKITKVYYTSKGIFFEEKDAVKKANRAEWFGSRPGETNLEPVKDMWVLVDESTQKYFALTEVTPARG
jgi:hypothetical protein